MKNGEEVWEVEIRDRDYEKQGSVFHVFATSAAEAEKRGLMLAAKEMFKSPYCQSAGILCVMD